MFEKIQQAVRVLNGVVHRTPVEESKTLNSLVNSTVFLKCENFQKIGAFKFRGAYHAISKLSDAEKSRGVLTYSSGNHAQAVALVGATLGLNTTIVMPENAPATKLAATEGYGATIVRYDPATTSREGLAAEIAEEHGYTIVPPYDHLDVVCGQGTAAFELFQEVGPLDYLLVPCGGGGLLSGSAISAKGFYPGCRVIGIEPELADDATRSFKTGKLVTIHNPPTIADGTRTPSLGKVTFPLVQAFVDDMHTVSEAEIIDAVGFLFYRTKMVVEPSGALGVAALLSGRFGYRGRVGVILSGGNIDGPTMRRILE
ncbi:MAG: threo-3-hydroxy-L-aspartate ammonia-lyase [Chloroflexota bacterium]